MLVRNRTLKQAWGALRQINDAVRLQRDHAAKMITMLRKLRPFVEDAENTGLKLVRDAGGTVSNDGRWTLPPLDSREEDESPGAFKARVEEFRTTVQQLQDDLRALDDAEVEVEVQPVSWKIFDDRPGTPEDKRQTFNANWFADADPFIDMEA